jgi:tRNA threonylcarbamoyladenosine biosynthesis protein TsaE
MVEEFRILSESEDATRKIAQKIAPLFQSGDLIILDGNLGAGKTYFVKGFTEGLHSKDLISSPTFSIANFYRTDLFDILHIDLYRIETIDEFNDLGLFDYFSQSIALIEWGKKFANYFEEYLLISFEINDTNTRTLTFESQGDKYNSTIEKLKTILKGDLLC